MNLPVLLGLAFASTAAVAMGIGMIFRALLSSGTASATRSKSLRRSENVYDQPQASGPLGKIDQSFDRLIIESGLEISPVVGFLWLSVITVLLGGVTLLTTMDVLLAVGAGIASLVLGILIIHALRQRRIRQIQTQLPHLLDMIARFTRAGRSVEQTFEAVGKEIEGPLSKEFLKCSQQFNMGRSFENVLNALAARLPLIEIRMLTTTLIVQRKTGGHLSETLERMSGVIRDRQSAARQMRASTGGGRMSAMIIAGIAPVAFIAIFALHREHLHLLFNDPFGQTLLIIGGILEIIGIFWVAMLLRNDQ